MWSFITSESDVNNDYDEFSKVLTECIDKHSPVKCAVSKHQSILWLTPALKISCQAKLKMYYAALANKYLWNDYKIYRNKLTSLIRLRKKQYYCEFINNHKNDARSMWQLINLHLGRSSKDYSKFNNMSADDLNNFFVWLGPDAVKDILPPRNDVKHYLGKSNAQSFFINPVTCAEIMSVVQSLPCKSSSDCEGISTKLIKQLVTCIVNPLTDMFNKSFTLGVFPDSLKIAKIVPIFKAGGRE